MTTDNEEGRSASVEKEALDNPFDGYGRPFSDNGGMSDTYNHDNPANNVGPYSGPNSYSINDVAPYAPPKGGEENPGQNVGPYSTPAPAAVEEAPAEEEAAAPTLSSVYRDWNSVSWFDGTSKSIYDRSLQAQHLRRQAKAAGDVALEDELAEQIDVLSKVAAEFDDSSLHEYVDALPGGLVALEYDDLIDGGLVDLNSFLSVGAHKLATEVSTYDWDTFKSEGARQWVAQKLANNPGLVKREVMAREAAIDYAKDKTMVLMDPVHRANVIDEFVTNAERYRREAAKRLLEDATVEETRRMHREAQVQEGVSQSLEAVNDEFLPGAYVQVAPDYDDSGFLNIGEDDGSYMYSEALDVIESSKRDWGEFTTEGAREWFFDKAADQTAMLKHDDITRRAARAYASDQTNSLSDQAFRTEVVRAFAESVEFLREAHVKRESHRTASVESNDFIDIYSEQDEILW